MDLQVYAAEQLWRAQVRSRLGAGEAVLATTAVSGFAYLPTCNGTPTGVPAVLPAGLAPVVIDIVANKLYFYSGGAWRDAGP